MGTYILPLFICIVSPSCLLSPIHNFWECFSKVAVFLHALNLSTYLSPKDSAGTAGCPRVKHSTLKQSSVLLHYFCLNTSLFDLQTEKKKKENFRHKRASWNMEWFVICQGCTLKASCAQEPQVLLVSRQAREEHAFGRAGMQEMASPALWPHRSVVTQDWAERLGYFDDVGLNSFHWLHFLPEFGLPSNASRPSLPLIWYFFGVETLYDLCVNCVRHKATLCWNTKPKITSAILLQEELYVVLLQWILSLDFLNVIENILYRS